MDKMRKKIVLFLVILFLLSYTGEIIYAQTTGKIAGKVYDAETKEPLIGANIMIEGTNIGAAAGMDGDFFILNVHPGLYTIRIQMMGYEIIRFENTRVSVNRTSYIEAMMRQAVIEGEVVVVQANKVAIKKDQTSSVRNVSADQIDILPVESLGGVISMQAGVVNGHFRGGRSTEVAYLVDGVEVTESFGGSGRAVDLEPESIQDLEVITGTFNAEYGNAMSGIVNAITKDGTQKFHGSLSSSLANYFTGNDDIFIGLKNSDLDRNQDYKLQLSGPILGNELTFFTNFRYQENDNHLNGIHRYDVDQFSDYSPDNKDLWYSEHYEDTTYVPMNRSKTLSFMGKVTTKFFSNIKLSLMYTLNDDEWHGNDNERHSYKYNPDGMAISFRRTDMYSLHINHMLLPTMFYEFKASCMDNYSGYYRYKDPLDSRYIHDAYYNNQGPGFYTGGQNKDHSVRTILDKIAKFDITWQANKRHSFKAGFSYTQHDLDNRYSSIRNKYSGLDIEGDFYYDYEKSRTIFYNYEPEIKPDSTIYSDIYRVKPVQFSGYIQDKMEFDEMVINIGVRYDVFDPNTTYPSHRRNPANQLDFTDENPDYMSTYPDADKKIQISPRFGLAYQLGKTALLRFSYGHFLKMPPMYAIYQNHSFQVAPTDYSTTMGNSQLKPEKTVQYEIGLWQEIIEGMGIEVALYYRDIYDLLSAKVISTFNQIEYGLYSNKDYGNAKGLEVKYDYMVGSFTAFLNYTLQYTRGNADNPTQTFSREGSNRDPINKLIPMSWDQRHTFNLTIGYNTKDYGLTLTGYYNSGSPFTWSPISESMLARVNLYPNNNWMPSRYSVDLNGHYDYKLTNDIKLRLSLNVYNLLDRLNEVGVNGQTGRAYTAIIREIDRMNHRSDFNEFEDRIQNPGMYSAPRMVKVGLGIMF